MKQRLGLLGGTFDPIHLGHLLAAESAREALSLDRVLFMPAAIPPHKQGSLTSFEDRYAMTLLATAGIAAYDVSRLEAERGGQSYTVDTLRILKDENADTEMFFIAGVDTVLEFATWKNPMDVCNLCKLVIIGRPGYDAERLADLPHELRAALEFVRARQIDISSTEIRARARSGKSIRFLVPPQVEQYILKKNLYRNGEPVE